MARATEMTVSQTICAAAFAAASLFSLPALAEQDGHWRLSCRVLDSHRVCELAAKSEYKSGREAPFSVSWTAINAPFGIVEELRTSVDETSAAGWNLIAVSDGDEVLARFATGEHRTDGHHVAEHLLQGNDLVLVVGDSKGRRAQLRLPSDGFVSAQEKLFEEVRRGANKLRSMRDR